MNNFDDKQNELYNEFKNKGYIDMDSLNKAYADSDPKRIELTRLLESEGIYSKMESMFIDDRPKRGRPKKKVETKEESNEDESFDNEDADEDFYNDEIDFDKYDEERMKADEETDEEDDENEIIDALSELSAEELLVDSMKAGKPVNVDIEVY